MNAVRQAHALSRHAAAYVGDLTPVAGEAVTVTAHAVRLYMKLALMALRPLAFVLLCLYQIVMPPLASLVRHTVIALTLQPRRYVIIEISVIVTLTTAISLERRFAFIRRTYAAYRRAHSRVALRFRNWQAAVNRKSQIAAAALPHVVFVLVATMFHNFIGYRSTYLLRGFGLLFFACVRPVLRTIYLLYTTDNMITDDIVSTPTMGRVVRADSSIIQSAPPAVAESRSDSPSDVTAGFRRRLRLKDVSSQLSDTDTLRRRAAAVAAEIENDGNSSEKSNRRLHIETPQKNLDTPESSNLALTKASSTVNAMRARSIRPASMLDPSDEVALAQAERRILRFWVVFGAAWGLRSLVWFFFPSFLIPFLNVADVGWFYLVVWAQLSITTGADVIYAPLAAFMQRRGLITRAARRVASRVRGAAASSIQADDPSGKHDSSTQHINLLFNLASALHLSDAFKSPRIWRFVIDSGVAVVLFVIFAFTPRMITFVATLIAGVLLPCMRSAAALESGNVNDEVFRRHDWLTYWSIFSLFDAIYTMLTNYLSWLPFWYHIKMAAIIWLQVPDFRGSVTVLQWITEKLALLLSWTRQTTVTPRKRKVR